MIKGCSPVQFPPCACRAGMDLGDKASDVFMPEANRPGIPRHQCTAQCHIISLLVSRQLSTCFEIISGKRSRAKNLLMYPCSSLSRPENTIECMCVSFTSIASSTQRNYCQQSVKFGHCPPEEQLGPEEVVDRPAAICATLSNRTDLGTNLVAPDGRYSESLLRTLQQSSDNDNS